MHLNKKKIDWNQLVNSKTQILSLLFLNFFIILSFCAWKKTVHAKRQRSHHVMPFNKLMTSLSGVTSIWGLFFFLIKSMTLFLDMRYNCAVNYFKWYKLIYIYVYVDIYTLNKVKAQILVVRRVNWKEF